VADAARKLKQPQTYDDLYPSRFLKATAFNGKRVMLTITGCRREELEGEDKKKEVKAIVSFKETERELVACKTNGLCMRDMFGNSLAGWIGKRVILFPSDWNGEPAIRVWGSPDIKEPFDVVVKLARRKPKTMRMHKSINDDGPVAKPPAETYPDDSGEVPEDMEPREPGED
jgi:hypothetical protein